MQRQTNTSGFTLMELIVVIIIIGVLASLAIPHYNQMAERFQANEAVQNLIALLAAQNRYNLENGSYKAGSGAGNELAAGDLDITINASQYFNTPKIFNAADVASITSKAGSAHTLSISTAGNITCTDGVG